jgi:hypothetical protein
VGTTILTGGYIRPKSCDVLLGREGIVMNHKKLRRLYREERLQVRRRGGRKRAMGTRAPMTLPQGPQPALEPGLPVGCFR